MFLGHFAVGLAAGRIDPRIGLGTALVASQLPDALWPYFLLSGVERVVIAPGDTAMTPLRFESYPWSHSLLMVTAWSALAALVWRSMGGAWRGAFLIAGSSLSHWFLDAASHRPDMPLTPWSGTMVGLGLWNSVPLTVLVEGLMFGGALFFYCRGRTMSRTFWVLIVVLLATYVGNIVGPPPPGVSAIAGSMILIVPIVWWWGNRAGDPVSVTGS